MYTAAPKSALLSQDSSAPSVESPEPAVGVVPAPSARAVPQSVGGAAASAGPAEPVQRQIAEAFAPLSPRAVGMDDARGPVQAQRESGERAAGPDDPQRIRELAQAGLRGPGGTLPYLAQIQRAFGRHDVSDAVAHSDDAAAGAAGAMGAKAFTSGRHVGFAPPVTLFTAAHEAAHVVQQRAGVQLFGGVGQAHDPYEQHADAVATRVSRGQPSEDLLSAFNRTGPQPETSFWVQRAPQTSGQPEGTAVPRSVNVRRAPRDVGATGTTQRAPKTAKETAKETAKGTAKGTPQGAGQTAGMGATTVLGSDGATESGVVRPQGSSPAPKPTPILMPEPPAAPSAATQARIKRAQAQVAQAASQVAAVPDARSNVQGARDAVAAPKSEAQAQASADLLGDLSEREPASPEIVELCARIRQVIADKRPPDESALVQADPEAMAKEAGRSQQAQVQGDVSAAAQTYGGIEGTPQATPERPKSDLPNTPKVVETQEIQATAATPDAVPARDVSLGADVAANHQQVVDAGMTGESAQAALPGAEPGNPLRDAASAEAQLGEMARESPAQVLAAQGAALAAAGADMAALQRQAKASLLGERSGHVGAVKQQQQQMKLSEEERRQKAGQDAETLFSAAQSKVSALLSPLPDIALKKWQANVDVYARQFKERLQRVDRWIKKRHADIGAAIFDYFAGLPDWVQEEYDRAEKTFGDQVCKLITDISSDVNGVLKTCQKIIDQARRDIASVFAGLGGSQSAWAEAERQKFEARLSGLAAQVKKSRDDVNRELVQRAGAAVQDVRGQIAKLREEAKGVIGRIRDAVAEFAKDPARFILNALLKLVGIPPPDFWALVNRISHVISDIAADPKSFGNNLLKGIGDGFQGFFDHFAKHLLNGFLDWLFTGIRQAGVPLDIPREFSAGAIVRFLLQLLGISWATVRKLLVEQLGEENVARLEKAASFLITLVSEGLDGVVKLLKDALDPAKIVETIIETGVRFLVETLVTKAIEMVVSMFNPVGAIYQVVRAIYKVLSWVFRNAARIFRLVEAVVNGIADIVAGNVAGMAKTVETALAGLIAPVIDFIAGLIGLDGLPGKIAGALKSLQGMVQAALRVAVGWLVEQGKRLLAKLGLGGKEAGAEAAGGNQIGEVLTFHDAEGAHKLWVERQGNKAKLMVASDVQPVDKLLADKEKAAEQVDAAAPEKGAQKALKKARAQVKQVDDAASQIAAKLAAGGGAEGGGAGPIEAQAQQVKQGERGLKEELPELKNLLAGGALPGHPKVGTYGELSNNKPPRYTPHHVPPKSLANWIFKLFDGLKGNPLLAQDSEISKEMDVARRLGVEHSKGGVNLSSILIDQNTHIKKTNDPAVDDYRVHHGKKTAELIEERLRKDHPDVPVATIKKVVGPSAHPEDDVEETEHAAEGGKDPVAAGLPSTQFYLKEYDAARRQVQLEQVADAKAYFQSIHEVFLMAWRQSLAAVKIGLEHSGEKDGTLERKKIATEQELPANAKDTWEHRFGSVYVVKF